MKGAIKKMEMMVKHTPIDYDNAQATVLMVGNNSSPMNLKIAQDHDKAYSGDDLYSGSTTLINGIGFTASNDKTAGDAVIAALHDSGKPVLTGGNGAKDILLDSTNTPVWLSSPEDAKALLAQLQIIAVANSRYFTTATPPAAGNYGDDGHSKFTFVDGDFTVPDGKKGGGVCRDRHADICHSAGWDDLFCAWATARPVPVQISRSRKQERVSARRPDHRRV
jgi:hypothetical protein